MTDDISRIDHETFESHVGSSFRVGSSQNIDDGLFDDGGEPLLLELVKVELEADKPPAEGMRIPFSLFLEGPKDRIIPQGYYRLESDAASFDLFLVPIVSPGAKQQYQVVYN